MWFLLGAPWHVVLEGLRYHCSEHSPQFSVPPGLGMRSVHSQCVTPGAEQLMAFLKGMQPETVLIHSLTLLYPSWGYSQEIWVRTNSCCEQLQNSGCFIRQNPGEMAAGFQESKWNTNKQSFIVTRTKPKAMFKLWSVCFAAHSCPRQLAILFCFPLLMWSLFFPLPLLFNYPASLCCLSSQEQFEMAAAMVGELLLHLEDKKKKKKRKK